jgi:recombination protein RecA
VKNKCAMPFGEAEFDIRWGVGIDSAAELLDIAESRDALTKNGAYYVFDGKTIGHGRERTREALLAQPELRAAIEAAVRGEKTSGSRKKAA